MTGKGLVLVHGLFLSDEAEKPGSNGSADAHRAQMFEKYGDLLGVRDYEWVGDRGKALPNFFLRLARGTQRAVDAVEIMELDEAAAVASLADESMRAHWRKIAACAPYGFDAARSFLLIGSPIQLLEGPAIGRRILWFGRGLGQFSEEEFVAHYTGHHGPLVAGYAQTLGLRRYRQVPSEQSVIGDSLRELGLGKAVAPAVFAELVMGMPPLNAAGLRDYRSATREIGADEKRHIDFSRSMLLLA